ncbi:hypothetical protein SGLAM104S_02617 [Streptomyces glaucescens]
MDGFHLADAELERLGRRDRKGAPDTFDAAGYAALLRRLREDADGEDVVYAPGFERVLEQPLAGAVPVKPAARLVVTEGNYLLLDTGAWARVRPQLDEVWFCELDEGERIAGSWPGTRRSARRTRRRWPGCGAPTSATPNSSPQPGSARTWWCRSRTSPDGARARLTGEARPPGGEVLPRGPGRSAASAARSPSAAGGGRAAALVNAVRGLC